MSLDQACCTRTVNEINEDQLPLCCPPPDKRLWDAHPRVYLPIEKIGEKVGEKAGRIACPYCGSIYQLKE